MLNDSYYERRVLRVFGQEQIMAHSASVNYAFDLMYKSKDAASVNVLKVVRHVTGFGCFFYVSGVTNY